MRPTLADRVAPTASMLVSRAWVIAEVARAAERHPAVDAAQRARLVDALCDYERPRRHGLRDNLIVWTALIGLSMLAHAAGLPGWSGFVAGLVLLTLLARALMVKALRWELGRLLEQGSAGAGR